MRYEVRHTADVDADVLRAGRRMLDTAFDGGFTDDDWDHSRGGIHVIAFDGGSVIGHGAVVQRRLAIGGRAHRVGYVEGLGVHPEWQRRGIGSRMMAEIERVLRGAYDFGALATTDEGLPLYRARGWLEWRGPLAAMTPTGPVSAPDAAGGVYVFPAAVTPDVDQPLMCDWRNGDLW